MEKFSRAGFLRNTAMAAAALALPKWSASKALTPPEANDLSDAASIFLINKEKIFLNNGTMGPSPQPVVEAFMEGLADVTQGARYGTRKQESLDALTTYLGVEKGTIAITHSTTEGINMMANGVQLKAGDEIIVTDQEHIGNAAPWLYRAKREKLVVRTFAPADTAEQTLARLKKLVTAKTRVIAVPHITCTNGQVLPIKEICVFARSKNILTCVDGAHGAGMLNVNVRDLGCDFYAGCCHKWLLAAQGTAYLYVAPQSASRIAQKFIGADGTMRHELSKGLGKLELKPVAGQGFMMGTQSAALLNSITAAVQLHQGWGKANVENKVLFLSQYLYDALEDIGSKVQILSPSQKLSRSAMIACKLAGSASTKKLYEALLEQNFITRFVAESDLNCLRISTHVYNSTERIDMLIRAIKDYKV